MPDSPKIYGERHEGIDRDLSHVETGLDTIESRIMMLEIIAQGLISYIEEFNQIEQ